MMKLISVIRTVDDIITLNATRAPDLLRRDFVKNFGSSYLIGCFVPPANVSVGEILARAEIHFSESKISLCAYQVSGAKMMRWMLWEIYCRPNIIKAYRRLRRPISKQLWRVKHRMNI
ncbi:hypothetical protein WNY59_06405 [Ahrensia kielensis]|uniref:Uncharacterized protein n=1 Tax=Ahrensia kielensis TaxID=76980 RepID=A0ABU9T515_9HYPH